MYVCINFLLLNTVSSQWSKPATTQQSASAAPWAAAADSSLPPLRNGLICQCLGAIFGPAIQFVDHVWLTMIYIFIEWDDLHIIWINRGWYMSHQFNRGCDSFGWWSIMLYGSLMIYISYETGLASKLMLCHCQRREIAEAIRFVVPIHICLSHHYTILSTRSPPHKP